ncbi:MAG: T9SS type A sorting domain-containing protein [Bacteroidales bacterium]|nr:T9SS type A sorting domain-containing protein [Bacteroidales bacterium]
MKHSLTLVAVFCLLLAQSAFAQNIELTFTGADAAGKYVQLDSVRVENISRSWAETIVYPDTILTLTDETGVSEVEENISSCISYPNPFNGTSRIVLTLPQDEQLSLRVYNLAGQLVMEKHLPVEAGESHFEVSLNHPQVYFLVAQTTHGRLVQKLINTGHSGTNGIVYRGTNSGTISVKTQKLLSSKPFQLGDVLRITGYTTHYGLLVCSTEILQPQRESEHFSLVFALQYIPTLTTASVSNITDSSAVCGGTVTDDGGAAIITRGVCWSESPHPTIDGSNTADSSGMGSFTSQITELTAGTTYYVRAYATNVAGTAYGNEISFTTIGAFSVSDNLKVIFSSGNLQWSATNGGNTATTHAVAGNGTAAGTWRFAPHQWDTIGANNRNISSTYTGWIDLFGCGTSGYDNKYPYTSSKTDSDYFRGFDNNFDGGYYDWGVYNAIYNPAMQTTDAPGSWRTLTDNEWKYVLFTRTTASGIRYAKATVNGVKGLIIVPDNWDAAIYTLNDTNSATVGYSANTIDSAGWAKMEAATCVFLPTTGQRSGTSVSDVGSDGYYWSTTGKGTTTYNLTFNARYVVSNSYSSRYRGYAVRLVRNANASMQSVPTVTTTYISNITGTTADIVGKVMNGGGTAVTARGVCWSRSHNPTLNDNHTTNGSGMGGYTAHITGLSRGTTYYVRAYATNAVGTAYGNELTLTTPALPTLTTTSVSNITDSSAVCGGTITNDGGATISARGICWDTLPYPTISKSHTIDGSGTGVFTSNITGLKPSTKYYVRAYATSAAGTAYGNQDTFATLAPDKSFSVAAGKYVRFSPGNLQWSFFNGGNSPTTHAVVGNGTAAGTWRFAPHQWDTIGHSNSINLLPGSGWIDLFAWGTSGYNGKHPYIFMDSSHYYGFYNNNDISGTNYDWGVYNAIYNPSTNTTDAPGTWRTPTKDEWEYLLKTRATPSGIRFAKATVHGVCGLIIVPDNWNSSIYTLDSANCNIATFESNLVNASHWANLEAAGCVFLPITGYIDVETYAGIYFINTEGGYWSSSSNSFNSYSASAYYLIIRRDRVEPKTGSSRDFGFSVRLVKDVR